MGPVSAERELALRVTEAGFKANMTDFQAALGLSQLRRESTMRFRRTAIACRYSTAFAELRNLVELPTVEEGVRSAWHLYPLRLASGARLCRNQLIDDLNELGIGTSVHFIPVHLSPYFREHRGSRRGVPHLRGRLLAIAIAPPVLDHV